MDFTNVGQERRVIAPYLVLSHKWSQNAKICIFGPHYSLQRTLSTTSGNIRSGFAYFGRLYFHLQFRIQQIELAPLKLD